MASYVLFSSVFEMVAFLTQCTAFTLTSAPEEEYISVHIVSSHARLGLGKDARRDARSAWSVTSLKPSAKLSAAI